MKTILFSLALSVIATTASALQSGDFTYTINTPDTNTVTITDYAGVGGAVAVPAIIDDMLVTSIGESAFGFYTSLTSVTIPDSVTSIEGWAFDSCINLMSVAIPDSVTSIGSATFSGCTNLDSVTIPNSVTNIGQSAFMSCTSFTSITIPDSVTTIGECAFNGCYNLTNVKLGNSVTSIEEKVFYECTSLTSITIPDSVTTIGNLAFENCIGLTNVYFEGNAPSLNEDVFNSAPATVYYMLGTTGWTNPWGDRPTVLWNPVIQLDDGSFGVLAGEFGFNIAESASGLVVVKACTNLNAGIWVPIQTNTMTGGSVYFSDSVWINHPNRYYRISMP
jgi:hypothetical protein